MSHKKRVYNKKVNGNKGKRTKSMDIVLSYREANIKTGISQKDFCEKNAKKWNVKVSSMQSMLSVKLKEFKNAPIQRQNDNVYPLFKDSIVNKEETIESLSKRNKLLKERIKLEKELRKLTAA